MIAFIPQPDILVSKGDYQLDFSSDYFIRQVLTSVQAEVHHCGGTEIDTVVGTKILQGYRIIADINSNEALISVVLEVEIP